MQTETENQMISRIEREVSPILAQAIRRYLADGHTIDDVRKLIRERFN